MNVLILCTGNSARSILAEAILTRLGKGDIIAYSAGSLPKGVVHPLALELLKSKYYPIASLRSKSWDEFTTSNTPEMDIVITVCDRAANETCPIWQGNPLIIHWGVADPDRPDLSMKKQKDLFKSIYQELEQKFIQFIELDITELNEDQLQQELQKIV
ncbi:MAG: arsenate reductase [Gammaproteobacteria bacterium]